MLIGHGDAGGVTVIRVEDVEGSSTDESYAMMLRSMTRSYSVNNHPGPLSFRTHCDNRDSRQTSDEANHRRYESGHTSPNALLQSDRSSSTSVLPGSLAVGDIRNHSRNPLGLVPSCSAHHPIAEQRPEENDKGQTEGNEEQWVVKTSKLGVQKRQEDDRNVEDDREKRCPEVEARRVGELSST